MIAQSMVSPADQQVLDLFEFTVSKKPERALYPHRTRLKRRIREVMYGERPAVHLYSARLKTDLWLVNEGLADPLDAAFEGKAVTMQALAEYVLNGGNDVRADHDLPLHKPPCEP